MFIPCSPHPFLLKRRRDTSLASKGTSTRREVLLKKQLELVSCPRNSGFIAGGQLAVFQGAIVGEIEKHGAPAEWADIGSGGLQTSAPMEVSTELSA
jgi:hypothetical protein